MKFKIFLAIILISAIFSVPVLSQEIYQYNIDAERVMEVIREDPRCSPRYLRPGWHYTGYCLPKDTSELIHSISDNYLLKNVDKINEIIKKRKNEDPSDRE